MKKVTILLLFIVLGGKAMGQVTISDSAIGCWMVNAHFGAYQPFADMRNMFGITYTMGGEISYKTKTNWYFGVQGSYLFGRTVKDNNLFDSLYTKDTLLIGNTGSDGGYALFERGYTFEGDIGRLIPINSINPNSGILITGGLGFLQHKIRIEDVDQILYQLDGAYAKGYSRLTNGVMITQTVMFLNADPKHLLNFKVGLNFMEAFTKDRLDFNFDTRVQDNTTYLDILIGLKVVWMLPFYSIHEERFYTN